MRESAFDRNEQAERMHNDSLAQNYFDIWDTHPIQIFTTSVESKAISRLAQRGDKVLVVGVGGGRELPALFNLGCKVVAIDLSPEMLEKGRERFPGAPVTWQIANANDLTDFFDQYDLVIALGGVVNYLLDLYSFFESLRSVLRPGGRFMFDCFNSEFIGEWPDYESNEGRIRRPYSVEYLTSGLSRAGFRDFSIEGFRFLVDLLPPAFNADAGHPGQKLLEKVIEVEKELLAIMPANSAKFLVCSGQRA